MLTNVEKALAFCIYVIFMHSLLPKLAKQLSTAKAEREIYLSCCLSLWRKCAFTLFPEHNLVGILFCA